MKLILKKSKLNNPLFLEGLFLSAIIFFLFYLDMDSSTPNIYNLRDYLRVQNILNGHLIWFGPELSRSGNIPGPFYYYFILIPYYLGGYKACAYFMALTISLPFGAMWIFLDRPKFKLGLSIAFIIFAINPTLKNMRDMAWNPSYLLPFWCALILLFYFMINKKEINLKWIFFCLIAAFATQLHMSSLFWIIIGSAFYLFVYNDYAGWGKGIIFFIVPFLPYFIWLLFFKSLIHDYHLLHIPVEFSTYLTSIYKDRGSDFSLSWILYSIYAYFGALYLEIFCITIIARLYQAFKAKKFKILKIDALFLGCFLLADIFIFPVFINRNSQRYLLVPTLLGLCYMVYGISQFYKTKIENFILTIFAFLLFY